MYEVKITIMVETAGGEVVPDKLGESVCDLIKYSDDVKSIDYEYDEVGVT